MPGAFLASAADARRRQRSASTTVADGYRAPLERLSRPRAQSFVESCFQQLSRLGLDGENLDAGT
jgi:hypothetical protein